MAEITGRDSFVGTRRDSEEFLEATLNDREEFNADQSYVPANITNNNSIDEDIHLVMGAFDQENPVEKAVKKDLKQKV